MRIGKLIDNKKNNLMQIARLEVFTILSLGGYLVTKFSAKSLLKTYASNESRSADVVFFLSEIRNQHNKKIFFYAFLGSWVQNKIYQIKQTIMIILYVELRLTN